MGRESVPHPLVPYPLARLPCCPHCPPNSVSLPCPLPSAPNNKALSPSMPCPSQSLWEDREARHPHAGP